MLVSTFAICSPPLFDRPGKRGRAFFWRPDWTCFCIDWTTGGYGVQNTGQQDTVQMHLATTNRITNSFA